MKFSFLLISAVIVLFACNKDNTGPITVSTKTPAYLQNHNWVFDSSLTVTSNYSSTSYATAEEQTIVFSNDTLVRKTGSYSLTYNTAFESPDRIYLWLPGTTENLNIYLQINSTTDSTLVTSEFPVADQIITTYYHSK